MSEDSNLKRSRASGEVLDYLLREFERNQNPNPDQRKEISERTNMTEKAVRIWFQNRRAKLRKFERMGKPVKPVNGKGSSPRPTVSGTSSRSNLFTNSSAKAVDLNFGSVDANELNDKYCFIDCSSLSVGTWQRIKSGQHDHQALKTSLVNLSPFTLDQFMNTVDLMVILSKKNNEVNYFFAAVSNNSKILFRIFYPVSSVISSSLLENTLSKENSELRLKLSHTPKFSVYFFNGINSNLNQWSICDDFSEAHQVSSAFYAPGGTSTPHVIVGTKSSLDYLHEYIRSQNQKPTQDYDSSGIRHYDHKTSGSGDVNDFHASHSEEGKGAFDLSQALQEENDFRIKHELDWNNSPRDEHNFAIKNSSHLGEFEKQSQSPAISHHSSENLDAKFLANAESKTSDGLDHSEKKPENEYTDIFTDAPDFFNAVQTPSNHQISNLRDHENLINSPSTHVQPFVNSNDSHQDSQTSNNVTEVQSNTRQDPALVYSVGSQTELQKRAFTDAPTHHQDYGFEVQIPSNDFQPHDLLIDSPALTNNTPTPGHNDQMAHEDQFIDYNGDA